MNPAGPAFARDPRASAGSPPETVLARLWAALREVEDPEIPVSLVDMGLIVAVDYAADERAAQHRGGEKERREDRREGPVVSEPAQPWIRLHPVVLPPEAHGIRARLLREPDVDRVDIEVVWDPVWTHRRLSQSARESMRELGLSV